MLQSDIAPPPIELGVTIDARGTVVPKTGEATVSGTLTCSQPVLVGLDALLTQRIGRVRLEGYSGTGIECDGTATWALPISAYSGLFTAGKAEVQAVAYSYDEDGYAEAFQQVRLTGGRPAVR